MGSRMPSSERESSTKIGTLTSRVGAAPPTTPAPLPAESVHVAGGSTGLPGVSTGATVHKQNTTLAGRDETAWSHAGDKVAFWGVPPIGSMTDTYLYAYDTGTNKLTHGKPITNVAVTGIAWAPDDSLIAYALHAPGQADDRAHLWTAVPGVSSTPTDLGGGSLPVWLP